MRTDRTVQRRLNGRSHEPGHGRDAAGGVDEELGELAPAAGRGAHGAKLLVRAGNEVSDGLAHKSHFGRLGLGTPGVDVGRRRFGLGVEHDGEQIRARDAVDHAVVHLRHEGPVTVLEALDHPHLPQRLSAIELLGHQPADEVAQLLIAARRRQRGVPQVVPEVEVRVIDPHRAAQIERDEAHLLAVARHERELAGDEVGEVAVVRGRSLEDPDRTDVHMVRVVLDVQERCVQRAHAIHRRPPVRYAEGTATVYPLPQGPERALDCSFAL